MLCFFSHNEKLRTERDNIQREYNQKLLEVDQLTQEVHFYSYFALRLYFAVMLLLKAIYFTSCAEEHHYHGPHSRV